MAALYRYRGQVLPAIALELLMSAPELTFVSIRDGSRTVATGRGSLASAWLGSPPSRWPPMPGGRAWRVLSWRPSPAGARRGAPAPPICRSATATTLARRLYESAGFSLHHRYDYLSPGPA